MPEIGTSGSMSGEGKRGDAQWLKPPRPSSTLLRDAGGGSRLPHGRYVIFQMDEVAVPRDLFADILRRIDRLRPNEAPVQREQSTAARIV